MLKLGRVREADALVKACIGRGVSSPRLVEVNATLLKALHGPPWPRRHEYKTRHYHVVSDIDRESCVRAGKLLEQAYALYTMHLEPPKDIEKRRFLVYLFRGKTGYDVYCRNLFGQTAPHSAGLYSLHLKQLLIWNQTHKEAMFETVRH